MEFDLTTAAWLNEPKNYKLTEETLSITTESNTDLWQRSFYGFRNDNAPALLVESQDNFSFTARAGFEYSGQFDQCGILLYLNSDNWFKASIEHEDSSFSRLGSVVTNNGYSDWATTDIKTTTSKWYRLSRRGPDFLAESSPDGKDFTQLRVFHMHKLGETTEEMAKSNPPLPAEETVRFGLYACSPLASSFEVTFDSIKLENCLWSAHV